MSISVEVSISPPTFTDILRAKQLVAHHLLRTPLINYAGLDQLIGARVLVKHENHHPVGAFKVRGGINLVARLSTQERARGVIAASTGNHGQSIAYAARLFGVRATIVVPQQANPLKVAAIRNLGADLLFHGNTFDEAREYCEELARTENIRYVHSGNEPLLIAGVATIALEIVEEAPEVDTIIVPIGGGSGAAAACLAAKTLNPRVRVIGVQAERAPAAYNSWREKKLLAAEMATAAEGLATSVAFALPQHIIWERLDGFVLVSEEELLEAVALYVEKAHTLAEAAGAASLAAALKLRTQLAGQTVALVLSGGNITVEQLRAALATL
ncbi:MAG: pyridoxal-phosphate dependent enzyme [Acidobacteriota bacterium]